MHLNTMDCTGRSNINERDSELGDDMSHEDHSDDDMRDCDSVEGDHISRTESHLNTTMISNGAADMNGPNHSTDIAMSHHRQFPTNHPLNALGSFMSIGNLHGIPNLQHNDVLEKLKMQVRDMKVGLMDQEYAAAHAAAFGSNVLPTPINTAFTLPPTTMASFTHAAQSLAAQGGNNLNSHLSGNSPSSSAGGPSIPNGSHNSFSFTSPTAPNTKEANPASNSSTSSETSNSSQHNNGWSFEEQYKQVRQLYEINDDPKRKEFLDDLFSFMQKRGTPINRLPIMAKSVLDLYELYNLVIARGGLVDVINKKLWQEIIKGLHLPSSITSAAFTLRTQYMKYLYPYECEKKNLSTPAELQAAIDGNRREGRRSSYGQYEAMHNQMQMPQIGRQSLPGGMQQISPLALVTHAANNQQAQAAAAAAAAHHRLMAPSFGQVPNLVTQEIEQRMIEYLKLIQVKKEQNAISNGSAALGLSPHHQQHQQQQQQQRPRSPSPEISTREALNALEMSRVALWQMYHNNTSPPASVNTSPQGGGTVNSGGSNDVSEAQRSEVLNLSESPPNLNAIKRERELEPSPAINENNDFHHQPPPAKRAGFPASFYLPPGMSEMAAAAAAANYHYKGSHHDSDAEVDEENDDGEQNITVNSSRGDPNEAQHLSGSSLRAPRHHGSNSSVHNDKSDDSAIENSPSTSAASAGNGNISPVSTKKIHLTKQTQPHNKTSNTNTVAASCSDNITIANSTSLGPFEALNLLSGMQFRVTRNGTNSKGEPELAVNLELNGIKYSGVLISNISNLATVTATSLETMTPLTTVSTVDDNSFSNKNINNSQNNENNSTTSCSQKTDNLSHISTNINNNSKEANNDLVVSMDAIEDTSELTVRDVETPSNTSMTTAPTITATANAVIANGPNSSTNSLKDALITP